jgi:uncharacterized membrane protein YccC
MAWSLSSLPARALPAWLPAWLRGEYAAWLFVAKAALAFYLAAWLAMRLQLEAPSTTLATVCIVMHPQSGMVLAKSFYRVLGTVLGSLVALALMGAFPQQRVLFLLSLSLWVGLCAGGAALYRNFMSYGFVLAGYTAAIVATPAIGQPTRIFDSAVMRVSEVLLGVLVAGLVSDVAFPQRMRSVLRVRAAQQYDQFIDVVRDAFSDRVPPAQRERTHLAFVRNAVELEDLRATVIFEDAQTRARSRRLQLFNHYYMAASTSFQSLHRLLDRLARQAPPVAERLKDLCRPLQQALHAPDGAAGASVRVALAQVAQALPAQASRLRTGLPDPLAQQAFDGGASLLLRFTDELQQFASAAAQIQQRRIRGPVERVVFLRGNDYPAAAVAVVRTTLTMIGLCLLWVLSGWAGSIGAVTLAAAFVGLFATMRQPLTGMLQLLLGFSLGAVAAVLVTLGVLPLADGFALLIACTLPLLLVGLSLLARAPTALTGTGYLLGYVGVMGIRNPMSYAQLPFVNGMLAQVLCVGLAAVAFMLLPGVPGSAGQRQRLLGKLRRQVVLAARGALDGLGARFESVIRDLLQQIVSSLPAEGVAQRQALAWALSVNESGRALIELRRQLATPELAHPAPVRQAVMQAIEAVARFYAQPSNATGAQAEQTLAQAARTVLAAMAAGAPGSHGLLADLQLLHGELHDEAFVLAAYMPTARVQHAR